MQVQKCSVAAATPASKPKLSYTEMAAKEGVYKVYSNNKPDPFATMVVVRNSEDGVCVLWYSGNVLAAAVASWNSPSYTFERIEGATVCFEIKE